MSFTGRRAHFRTCHLCEAMCGLKITTHGDRVGSIIGDEDDPFSGGHICPKGPALAELHHDPDRVRRPLRRRGAEWDEISWDEALSEAAERIHGIQRRHGNDAVGVYVGNPNAHNTSAILFLPLLLKGLRTRNRFSATSVDQLPHMFANYLMLGHQLLFPIPDIDRTDYLVVLGANPVASNGSLMTAPDIRRRLREIRARGKVVVVDPRRTETARAADQHHSIRPGSDAWLLLAMLYVAFTEGLTRLGRLEAFTDGFDAIEALARDEAFAPERAAERTGIAADAIRQLTRELARAERGVLYGRIGTCVQEFGGLTAWLINVVNIVMGHFDVPGGAMFTTPAIDVLAAAGGMGIGLGSYGRWKSRVRGLPEFGGELPVVTLAEEILTEGPGQIRGMVTMAGNPVLSTPGGSELSAALAGLDTLVSIDFYINETTRHARLILPPVSPLERSHYDLVFHAVAVRNTAKYSPPVFSPPADGKHDGEIALGLLRRLQTLRGGALSADALRTRALERLGVERMLDAALRLGPYGKGYAGLKPPSLGPKGSMDLAKLRDSPHGVDLGPLMPRLPERLPEGRIQLAPAPFLNDLPRLRRSELPRDQELLLIGRRHVRSNNSWMHNIPSLMKGRDRCTLMMHPADARERGVHDAHEVEVRSRIGAVRVPLQLTNEIMRGVVSLPHGFGHGLGGVRLTVAREHPGKSANDLTDPRAIDELTGNAILNGVPVEVSA